jgi:hypothetical protein
MKKKGIIFINLLAIVYILIWLTVALISKTTGKENLQLLIPLSFYGVILIGFTNLLSMVLILVTDIKYRLLLALNGILVVLSIAWILQFMSFMGRL